MGRCPKKAGKGASTGAATSADQARGWAAWRDGYDIQPVHTRLDDNPHQNHVSAIAHEADYWPSHQPCQRAGLARIASRPGRFVPGEPTSEDGPMHGGEQLQSGLSADEPRRRRAGRPPLGRDPRPWSMSALAEMSAALDELYASDGRLSIAPPSRSCASWCATTKPAAERIRPAGAVPEELVALRPRDLCQAKRDPRLGTSSTTRALLWSTTPLNVMHAHDICGVSPGKPGRRPCPAPSQWLRLNRPDTTSAPPTHELWLADFTRALGKAGVACP
jgi:hypothetical protein